MQRKHSNLPTIVVSVMALTLLLCCGGPVAFFWWDSAAEDRELRRGTAVLYSVKVPEGWQRGPVYSLPHCGLKFFGCRKGSWTDTFIPPVDEPAERVAAQADHIFASDGWQACERFVKEWDSGCWRKQRLEVTTYIRMPCTRPDCPEWLHTTGVRVIVSMDTVDS